MGWPVDQRWRDALATPHQLDWLVTATRGGVVLADNIEVESLSYQASWDEWQITREVRLEVCDPEQTLLSEKPDAPLAPWGQRVHVRARLSVGQAWNQIVPLGQFRIEETGVSAGYARLLQRDGTWLGLGQNLTVTGRDMLQQLADEKWIGVVQLGASTVRQGWARLVSGTDIGLEQWSADAPVPASLQAREAKLDTAAALTRLDGRVAWCDRAGRIQLSSAAVGANATWDFTPGDDVGVSWSPQATRTGIVNAAAVHGEDDGSSSPEVWGSAFDTTGPLAWGGPFGRIPAVETSKTATTTTRATAEAATMLTNTAGSRMATVKITAPANPAIDVLDTAHITTQGRTMTGLITAVDISSEMTCTVQVPWEQVWHD